MMRIDRTVLAFLAIANCFATYDGFATDNAWAQSETSASDFGAEQEMPLYAGVAPGSETWKYSERRIEGRSGPQLKDVVRPTLLYYPAENYPEGNQPAEKPQRTAMIVAPGGGNRTLMMSYEGVDIAKALNAVGVDAFVLKYRLNYTGPDADTAEPAKSGPQAGQNVRELSGQDGVRAVALLRQQAARFHLNPERIGMIGFSAGGGPIRAAMGGPTESQPNFVALIYATGNSDKPIARPEQAPPLFLAVSADDPAYQSSISTFQAWRAAQVPVELHIFQMGAHGFVNKGGAADHFMDRVADWMRGNGWLTPK